ncbi:hypothetical protein DFS33DRAFT_1277569 [Desarmillaria ectypa]|nr:hypothetical protein DFS33DRAFT_1277569 [Desarmillaria ectypa]
MLGALLTKTRSVAEPPSTAHLGHPALLGHQPYWIAMISQIPTLFKISTPYIPFIYLSFDYRARDVILRLTHLCVPWGSRVVPATLFYPTSTSDTTEKLYSKAIMPMLLLYVLKRLTCSFFTRERNNSWRTIRMAASFRFSIDHSDFSASISSSLNNYLQWRESNNMPATIDELPDGAHLLWIGPKRLDQVELEQRNIHVGIAILAYTSYQNSSQITVRP